MDSDQLRIGLSPTAAIDAFIADCECNAGRGRLFITKTWFEPFRTRLLAALPGGLTDVLAEALQAAVYKRRSLEAVVQFIEQQPITWSKFDRQCREKKHRLDIEHAKAGIFPWADVESCESDDDLQQTHRFGVPAATPAMFHAGRVEEETIRARGRSCPGCDRPASELTLLYFCTPPWTWEKLCGGAGWLLVCKPCRMQVDFFCEAMN